MLPENLSRREIWEVSLSLRIEKLDDQNNSCDLLWQLITAGQDSMAFLVYSQPMTINTKHLTVANKYHDSPNVK